MQLDGVMLFVAELEPMLAFYRDAVGFTPNDATRTAEWVEFDTGCGRFFLHQIPQAISASASPGARETASCKPIIGVSDLGEARERLAASGAAILDRPWGGWDFTDPEGNVIGIRGL